MALSIDVSEFFSTEDFADEATYTPASGAAKIDTRVIVTRDVDIVSPDNAMLVERRTVVSLMRDDIASPKRGDTITVGETVYTVDAVTSDNGYIVQVAVR